MATYICDQCAVITLESCTFSTNDAQNESSCKPAFVPTFSVWPALPVVSLISWTCGPHNWYRHILATVMTLRLETGVLNSITKWWADWLDSLWQLKVLTSSTLRVKLALQNLSIMYLELSCIDFASLSQDTKRGVEFVLHAAFAQQPSWSDK